LKCTVDEKVEVVAGYINFRNVDLLIPSKTITQYPNNMGDRGLQRVGKQKEKSSSKR